MWREKYYQILEKNKSKEEVTGDKISKEEYRQRTTGDELTVCH